MADVTNLAQVTEGGISCATFPEIKDALARKMQEIYGYDIDLSTASADGQYVMMEALVLNNIYRTLESLVNNLSLASASGKYLDILSNLSGVFRRQATYSTANIYVKNTSGGNLSPSNLMFLDKNGTYWFWINPLDIDGNQLVTFTKDKITEISVTCETTGPIDAIGGNLLVNHTLDEIFANISYRNTGDINSCTTSDYLVYQDENAVVGQSIESDSDLRSRRLKSLGQAGSTVLENMQGRLMSIPGVLDVIIYSNNTQDIMTVYNIEIQRNTVLPVVCAQNTVLQLAETGSGSRAGYYKYSSIGDAVYNTITPGIATKGNAYYEVKIAENVTNVVSWKQTSPMSPAFQITLTPANQADVNTITDQQCKNIYLSLANYFNNLRMDATVYGDVLSQIIAGADYREGVYGNPTYTVTKIEYANTSDTYTTIFETGSISNSVNLNLHKLLYDTNASVVISRTGGTTVTLLIGVGYWQDA